jgi:DNA replication protein DnaC
MNAMEIILNEITATKAADTDYLGEDGLLYCGKCRTPKELRLEADCFFGDRPLPTPCRCVKERQEKEAAEAERLRHLRRVEELKRAGFTDDAMRCWTFENDDGRCLQMAHARFYVEHFQEMERENIGYLLWGAVGTGKSYFAACIANALMEREIPVRMTNLSMILNDLNTAYDGRNEIIRRLNRCRLLILDDFGMERGTEYALEQVYSIVDSRYRSGKPLIVTTNLTLTELKHPSDTVHARIYDRVLEMCQPILISGESLRRENAEEKLLRLRKMMQASAEMGISGNTDQGKEDRNDRTQASGLL